MNEHFQKVCDCPQYPMNQESFISKKFTKLNQAGTPYVLVTVNIKNFKFLNLTYGWEQGNVLIYRIYLALESQLEEGEYIAHGAGDNYRLLLHTQMWAPEEAAANEFIQTVIMRFVDAIFEVADDRIYKNLYASFGICPASLNGGSFYEVLEVAELFRKNDKGLKQRTFTVNYYNGDIMQRFLQKYELGRSTANALQLGEYQVYVQPKVDLKTRKVVGGEALLRRFDADGTMIPLYKFLPILNEEGYIRKIDWFVFETACEKMHNRMLQGKPIAPISFNISKDFFYDVFMCDNYISTREKHEIPPEYIEFELMETISLDDTGRMVEVIEKFKRAGFKCSLDDFGNGYSSFGVLLNADLDYVKLDRIFFINPLDDGSKRILRSVFDILKYLGFRIVAEGVETKEYVDYLEELGCDIIQGFYFYRPMPIDEFLLLLEQQDKAPQENL